MNPLNRAIHWAAYLLHKGPHWKRHLPADGRLRGDVLVLDGVQLRHVGETFEITYQGRTTIVGKAKLP